MSKQTTRAFAAGLLSASLALLSYTMIRDDEQSAPSDKEMITELKQNGYVVYTKEEANQQMNMKQQAAAEPKPEKKSNKQEKTLQTNEAFTLDIQPGMTSSEIGSLLEKAGIVKDEHTFNDYLTKNGYAGKLQVGKYTLYPSMSAKQIAIVITTK
ncbi:endolytic transglycosylase MltG [Bacillus xiapuensis]|uniref:endolytic transglycosylase MltG n=1 Tax=Bacillus xiapuensis TaxID=2014075 RepID=UPI000C23D248|nr:endolytic transglycosylase MltG [Bacillus xiapuensis]